MKKFCAKVVVYMKPTVEDIKSSTLKKAIETVMPAIQELSCRAGCAYTLNFSANDQREALCLVEKIAKELLSNEVVETYEIRTIEEIGGEASEPD